jgi:hypothetical protein
MRMDFRSDASLKDRDEIVFRLEEELIEYSAGKLLER